MPRKKITPEIDKEIRRLAGLGKTIMQIAEEVKFSYSKVYTYLNENKIEYKADLSPRKRTINGKKRAMVSPEFFDEHERENWLI